ncbi:MAG TPA: DUF1329 domain-containing protein [Candidatus Binataceae bacterium]|jgi:hypothetical protein|nr:DUF1329 domain-containing protein [Candidatus Binataceae bacterium]
MIRVRAWAAIPALLLALLLANSGIGRAQEGTIPPGTVITLQNWQQYKQFMPDGVQALFAGKYFWKFPPDFRMVIGPTHSYPLPAEYLKNTEKYSGQVKIIDLPNGGHSVTGYVAGIPFPNPQDPLKGWKILANMWWDYIPHLQCGYDKFVLVDRFLSTHEETVLQVYRRTGHISDPGQPIDDPATPGIEFTEYLSVLAPEQSKYVAQLSLYYSDPTRTEDLFLFVPALRRSLRLSAAARCSPTVGTDFTQDDARNSNYNGGITRFQSQWLRDGKFVSLMNADLTQAGDLTKIYRPVFFPSPSIGSFEVRDMYVIDVRRVPSEAVGYCYGKKIIYVDKQLGYGIWTEAYDEPMRLWKILYAFTFAQNVPQMGVIGATNEWMSVAYDLQSQHLSFGTREGSRPFGYNEQCKNYGGENLDDIKMYSSTAGLNMIMK